MKASFSQLACVSASFVQSSLADIQWRLQRIPGLEMALFARGREEFAGQFEDQDPAVRSARIDLETFLQYQKPLRNLQIQEGRLQRQRQKDMAELGELQQERRQTDQHRDADSRRLRCARSRLPVRASQPSHSN